ncbi:hypothetical protein GCM10009122_56220 [Fulvivirga kasyanovii]|uniref:hypothetical protein n=1 Tax=Fulvivirga kasyanovii TaxID=396812 RepID=UPI0031E087C6
MKLKLLIILVGALLLLPLTMKGQPTGGGPGGGGDPDVPISGIEILLLSGGALGAGRLLSLSRKNRVKRG